MPTGSGRRRSDQQRRRRSGSHREASIDEAPYELDLHAAPKVVPSTSKRFALINHPRGSLTGLGDACQSLPGAAMANGESLGQTGRADPVRPPALLVDDNAEVLVTIGASVVRQRRRELADLASWPNIRADGDRLCHAGDRRGRGTGATSRPESPDHHRLPERRGCLIGLRVLPCWRNRSGGPALLAAEVHYSRPRRGPPTLIPTERRPARRSPNGCHPLLDHSVA